MPRYQYLLPIMLITTHSANYNYRNICPSSIHLVSPGRRTLPGSPMAFYSSWCRNNCMYRFQALSCIYRYLIDLTTNHIYFKIIFAVLLLKMPLYSNIQGRTIVYWLSNIGVSNSLLSKFKIRSRLPGFHPERCRSSHSELD